jgi:hypothetical protein
LFVARRPQICFFRVACLHIMYFKKFTIFFQTVWVHLSFWREAERGSSWPQPQLSVPLTVTVTQPHMEFLTCVFFCCIPVFPLSPSPGRMPSEPTEDFPGLCYKGSNPPFSSVGPTRSRSALTQCLAPTPAFALVRARFAAARRLRVRSLAAAPLVCASPLVETHQAPHSPSRGGVSSSSLRSSGSTRA